MQPLLALFLETNVALIVVLSAMVAVRKHRRDRRELGLRARRDQLRAASSGGGEDLRTFAADLRHHPERAGDFISVIAQIADRGDVLAMARMAHAAREVGLDDVFRARLRSRRSVTRGTAALALSHFRNPEAVGWIRPLLRDADGDVQLVAAGALARIATTGAAEALVVALAEGIVPTERLVERLGAAWAAPTVLTALRSGIGHDPLRCALARALGLAGHREAEAVLLDLLRGGDVEVRVSSARALATCGGSDSVRPLLVALGDGAWEVRAQAATSLGALGDVQSVPELARRLSDRAWWVRSNAAYALTLLGEPGLAALRHTARSDDRYAAERALEALVSAGLLDEAERAA
jgi:HEAT repeat protein